jgi:hypothetical protein
MPANLAWQNDHVSAKHLWYAIGTAHCLAFVSLQMPSKTDAPYWGCTASSQKKSAKQAVPGTLSSINWPIGLWPGDVFFGS